MTLGELRFAVAAGAAFRGPIFKNPDYREKGGSYETQGSFDCKSRRAHTYD